MRTIRFLIRIILALGTLVVASGGLMMGLFLYGPTGLFGVNRSIGEQATGYILLAVGSALVILAFSLLRKRIFISVLLIFVILVIGITVLGGMNQDVFNVVTPYTLVMIIGCLLDYIIGKKLPEEIGQSAIIKEQKLHKTLVVIPVTLLTIGWLYVNFGQYWIEEAKIGSSQKKAFNTLGYQLYKANRIPSGYSLRESRLGGIRSDYFYAEYRNSNQEYFMLAQFKKPKDIILGETYCTIYGNSTTSFEIQDINGSLSGISSSCEKLETPLGRQVYVMDYEIQKTGKLAATVFGDTLVTITGYTFPLTELFTLIDSLEAKNPPIKAPNVKNW